MLGQKQVQKISQKLALSKNMQQSINILSMHTIDLKDFIEKEIIENPFLETEEVDFVNNEESYKNLQSTTDNNYNQDEVFSKLVDKTLTLKEHLINQINLTFQDDNEKFIAYYVTDMLDDNGYFRGLDENIAQELKISLTKFNSIMNILKTFDPIGVYSQNLEECLKLQAIEKNIFNSKFKKILENLNLVAKLDFKSLKKECEISEEELRELISKLKKLNPKPGRDFLTNNSQIILPEIIIKGNKDQGFYPIINDKAVPNCFYQNNIDNKNLKPNEKSFCSKNKRTAIEVVTALTKRKKLLLNFADKILELQYEFFANGVNFLKPLVVSDLAKKLEVNESTISRIGNKYIETPHGVFEIKFFFSSKIKSELTENHHSSISVKNTIKDIICNEEKILSDLDISNILSQKYSISISRRTVTKYREFMKIPTSAIRKRLKKMGAS